MPNARRMIEALHSVTLRSTQRLAVQKQLHPLSVAIDLHGARTPFLPRPSPVPGNVQHRPGTPLALIEVVNIFRNAPDVGHPECGHVRRDDVIGLAVVIELVPDASARHPRPPLNFRQMLFMVLARRLFAVGAAVMDAASDERRSVLAHHEASLGMRAM